MSAIINRNDYSAEGKYEQLLNDILTVRKESKDIPIEKQPYLITKKLELKREFNP